MFPSHFRTGGKNRRVALFYFPSPPSSVSTSGRELVVATVVEGGEKEDLQNKRCEEKKEEEELDPCVLITYAPTEKKEREAERERTSLRMKGSFGSASSPPPSFFRLLVPSLFSLPPFDPGCAQKGGWMRWIPPSFSPLPCVVGWAGSL